MKTLLLALPLLLIGCTEHHPHAAPHALSPRPVSILVEVYDPATNYVWENVSVRVVEVRNEWSGCTCENPLVEWFLTDSAGQVFFDEYLLAASNVGFLEDGGGRAVLHPDFDEDEATVVLEIDAVGFTPVIVEVPLQWDVPDVVVEVPFS
ncbi:MAG: hypothetical protein U1E73_04655 [Planctomycetota bacterium]